MVAVPPLSTICVPTVRGCAAREAAKRIARIANVVRTVRLLRMRILVI
jgi:hypothetical protein